MFRPKIKRRVSERDLNRRFAIVTGNVAPFSPFLQEEEEQGHAASLF